MRARQFLVVGAIWGALGACGGSEVPTAPPPAAPPAAALRFDGEWSGRTLEGESVTFAVSGNRVTAFAADYSFRGCAGTAAASNLDVGLIELPERGSPAPSHLFVILLNASGETDYTQVQGSFESETSASGLTMFARPGCGDALSIWRASRH